MADSTKRGLIEEKNILNQLAKKGEKILRLPENCRDEIETIMVNGIKYAAILKYKTDKNGKMVPRGYPDAYFNGQTWDVKWISNANVNTIRKYYKEARKADNVIFVGINEHAKLWEAINKERKSRYTDTQELPQVYIIDAGILRPL